MIALIYSLLVSLREGMVRLRFVFGIFFLAIAAPSADAPIVPHTVCEILHDLPGFEAAPVAVLGRYSFREDQGRWLDEQACAGISEPPVLWLQEDLKDGPKPPGDFELDGVALNQKFADLRKRTSLARFRFGSSDYDRWAVVYGHVAARKGDALKKAPADLIFRGDGVVIFLTP